MTMHLVGPHLSLNGKKKGKQKFRNADAAKKARALDASWDELKKKWGVAEEPKRKRKTFEVWKPEPTNYRGRNELPASLNGGADMSPATLKESPKYTGTKMLGIATMHKSNSVPVFAQEDAIEISKMRR